MVWLLMASVTIKLDDKAILNQLTGPNGAISRDLLRRGNRVLNAARRNCPVDEGRLRASLSTEVLGSGQNLAVRIGSNLKYAVYVHEGTGIYAGRGYITPKNGKFLAWPNKGGTRSGGRRYSGGSTESYVFAKRVKGVKARPFLKDALPAARG